MRLCEETKIVPVLEPQDHQAGVDGDSVSMENYAHVCFIILFGELTDNCELKLYEGATAGTKTTALTFSYRYTAIDLKSAGADNLGTEATSAALSLVAATFEDRMLVIEVDDSELTQGLEWLTLEFSSDASELLVSVSAVMCKPRYAQAIPPTAIT